MREKVSVNELLGNVESLDWELELYFRSDQPLDENSSFLVINDEDEELRDANDEPLYPKERGFNHFLSVANAQDVMSNIIRQNQEVSSKRFIEALVYFFEHDAFICYRKKK
ncbi:hypothetical protein LRP50_18845 [Enterovibrio sp. ZSDZ42]|uniref:DUF7716 domain-containing protein n=1 Tax=Enterovibrio gelatinilyticus TaxID=2899819 RepID=A0ABT5R5R7_9GAMM|nr:hypothetical protein [Enterovibrio sp. ZSDZ42]MDD1795190.1 hypothetical protein [Enterovibrio sp. ZSDZ42]